MRTKTLFLYSKILSFLLVLFGVSSCDTKAEYGTPEASYKIKGKIIDQNTKQPIKGIQTILEETYLDFESYRRTDTLYSDKHGEFQFNRDLTGAQKVDLSLSFKDVDDTVNGSYNKSERSVDIERSDYIGGDGNWNDGTATKDLGNIELTSK